MPHSLSGQRLSPSTHKAIYLWGRGPIGGDLQTLLRPARVDPHNKLAHALATEHGCPVGIVEGTWALCVTGGLDEGALDALTRDDPAVMGWSADRNAKCEASVALQNALNSIAPDHFAELAGKVAAPFLAPNAPERSRDEQPWLARDGRLVVYDKAASRWGLGDYVPA